jgi:GAF domain-containing protein
MAANGDRVRSAVSTTANGHGDRRSPWVGIEAQVDPVRWARLLRRAYELALDRGARPSIVRDLVVRSWRRAAGAHLDPDAVAPRVLDTRGTRRALEHHPVAHLLPMVEAMLAEATDDARNFAVLSDAEGVLLWSYGDPEALSIAEAPRFLPGHLCSEDAVGTNAVGTALELDHPVQIFSAEHFNRRLHGWTCAAAPIHDPESHRVLGVLDLSGDFRTGHPHSLALVSAVARVVEGELARETAVRNERLRARYLERLARGVKGRSALVSGSGRVVAASPKGWLGARIDVPADCDRVVLATGAAAAVEPLGSGARILWESRAGRRTRPRSRLRVEALGRRNVAISLDGARDDLSPRHGEILVLLALNRSGLSARELGDLLYGGEAPRVTVRAEMSRLRRLLGPALARDPYRLDAELRSDFAEVERLTGRGDLRRALRRYRGPLLPGSEVPAIVDARDRVHGELRSCLLAGGDADALHDWARSPGGRDDREVHRRLLDLLEPGDGRRALAQRRLDQLDARR